MIKLKSLLVEDASGVELMGPEEVRDMGIDYYEDLNRIERESGIRILRDKELALLAVTDNKVVGALYTTTDRDEFSFDIIVDKPYRGKGIGKKLADAGLGEYNQMAVEFGMPLKLDVVNPNLIPYLKRKGLEIVGQQGGHTIMSFPNQGVV